MAIIINIDKTLYGEKPEQALVDTKDSLADVPENATPERLVQMEREAFDACQHREMAIDDKQRTVKCGTCKMWLDPVWCLRELFRYYQTRIDNRLDAIKAFEERAKAKLELKEKRRLQPRTRRLERRAELLQRAAYNEYQAKILAIRAGTQREQIAKIEVELGEPVVPEEQEVCG